MVMERKDRIRAKLKGDDTYIRVLLAHVTRSAKEAENEAEETMEEFIQDIRCWRNGDEVLIIKCGIATSDDPYFAFQLAGGKKGDVISE